MKININWNRSDKFILKIKNLEIKLGEIVGIMGTNGSGKSSLVNSLTMTYLNSKKVNFKPLYKFDVISQESEFGAIKLIDLVKLISNLNKLKIDINQLFIDYDLFEQINFLYKNLSSGQKQRFKFMMLELCNNEVLILDEIFNSLDSTWKKRFIQKISDLTSKYKIVLMIDHDLEIIKKYCNRLIYLKHGEIILDTIDVKNISQKSLIE